MSRLYKILALALCVFALVCVSAGCIQIIQEPKTTDAPEDTEAPVSKDYDKNLLGDWYGVFAVTDAEGSFKGNAGIANDCVMRVALDENGAGSAYIVVNTVGVLLKNCTAAGVGEEVRLEGDFNGARVEWSLVERGPKLVLNEVVGSGSDYMIIEMSLRHCGEEWTGDRVPEGRAYTEKYGFGGLVEAFGGSKAALPAVSGEGVNLRLSENEIKPDDNTEPSFDDPDRTVSADGAFSVRLPEGFTVVRDDGEEFEIADHGAGVNSVRYKIGSNDADPLDRAVVFADSVGVSRYYHYTVDGFDCYAVAYNSNTPDLGGMIVIYGVREGRSLDITIIVDQGIIPDASTLLTEDTGIFEAVVLGIMIK